MTEIEARLIKAANDALETAAEAQSLLRKALEEVAHLRARNEELEAMAGDENLALWRFWNAKARDLTGELVTVKEQLRAATSAAS